MVPHHEKIMTKSKIYQAIIGDEELVLHEIPYKTIINFVQNHH